MPDESIQTRETLLLRLRDCGDGVSWEEFAEIYTPLLYRYCQKREIRPHDIADIVQEVMRSVSIAMPGFTYDRSLGTFKGWLFTALRHAIGRHFTNLSRQPIALSVSHLLSFADSEPSVEELDRWDRDYEARLLAWAIAQVRSEFAERIWKAFEMTALEDRDPAEVAEKIGMTRNAVAIAKYRVIRRIREKAQSIDPERWEAEQAKECRIV